MRRTAVMTIGSKAIAITDNLLFFFNCLRGKHRRGDRGETWIKEITRREVMETMSIMIDEVRRR